MTRRRNYEEMQDPELEQEWNFTFYRSRITAFITIKFALAS